MSILGLLIAYFFIQLWDKHKKYKEHLEWIKKIEYLLSPKHEEFIRKTFEEMSEQSTTRGSSQLLKRK